MLANRQKRISKRAIMRGSELAMNSEYARVVLCKTYLLGCNLYGDLYFYGYVSFSILVFGFAYNYTYVLSWAWMCCGCYYCY